MRRSEIAKSLEQVPDKALFGSAAPELTHKQKKFARSLAKGATKAQAYRDAYNVTSKATIASEPYTLAKNPKVAKEIEAYKLAMEAQEYRTPLHLRALIVQTLTQTILDPDTPPAVRVQAVRVLGSITEVAAFTHRTETTVVKKSEDAKAELLKQLQSMLNTVDEAGTSDAEALLAELAGPHPGGATPDASVTHHGVTHSIPHTESQNFAESPLDTETPPGSDEK